MSASVAATAHVASPAAARRSGLVPVYQEPSLIPDLSVADNLRLGQTPAEPFRHWVTELGIPDLRLDDMIGRLPLATLRILDLARALAVEPDVLLLDEMTAALPTDLVERVLTVVREQADCGPLRHLHLAPLHRNRRALRPRHRPARRRDRRRPAHRAGRRGAHRRPDAGRRHRRPRRHDGPRGAPAHRPSAPARQQPSGRRRASTDVSFDLHAGEVLGVVALEGQGQDELFDVLAGNRRATVGPDRGGRHGHRLSATPPMPSRLA